MEINVHIKYLIYLLVLCLGFVKRRGKFFKKIFKAFWSTYPGLWPIFSKENIKIGIKLKHVYK